MAIGIGIALLVVGLSVDQFGLPAKCQTTMDWLEFIVSFGLMIAGAVVLIVAL